MKFDPKQTTVLLEEGWYEALILNATEKSSKSGNPMMEVVYRVFGPGKSMVFDYFLPDNPASLSRFKKLCKAIDVDFDSGEVTPDMLKNAHLEGYIKTRRDPEYGDKNVLATFRKLGTGPAMPPVSPTHTSAPVVADPSVPF